MKWFIIGYDSHMQTTPETLICTAKVRKEGSLETCANPRANQDPNATNRHCTSCQTAAKKRNEMDKKEQTGARAWSAGVEAMAEHVARAFEAYKSRDSSGNLIQRFGGPEIADIVRRCERPKFTDSALAGEAG